tara:strand:- start:304 stop:1017 length:714 start_codon:yes stop_codon:yes gene_type:complete
MNTLILLLTSLALSSSPATSSAFKKPLNYDKKVHVSEAINFVNLEEGNPYIRVRQSEEVTYEELRYYALHDCKNNSNPSEQIVDALIAIEREYNPAPAMRGMILAAACTESGFNPLAKGDRRFSRNKKTPMAIGVLQLWPIYERMYPGLDRTDPEQAGRAWMNHIVKMIPKVKRQCKYRTQKNIWLAAWVTGIRYKKPGGRCKERPKHYRLLKRWHRQIKKDKKHEGYCRSKDTCGC